ncbi:MAG: right-handed parallel beta-helix repeat-containing protein [Oscillospiraceae bacterium]|nr:right-handed parallel beta-helix repeat-containing protein [Oscillospiraceae bacterium]MCL2279893.1 right-handed parallel beta-helix repeat-containing protein [Oscillospiraceae bacterium]
MATTYHVAKNGLDINEGTYDRPFLTIGMAAKRALPGDTVTVHAGEYREWVKPKEGGLSNNRRITYQAAEGELVIIKGSERVQSWEKVEGTVWKAVLPNTIFGDFNPYVETVCGDWLLEPWERPAHLGDVYLNGMSFYEADSLEKIKNPKVRDMVLDHWTKETVPIKNKEQTKYVWTSEVDGENTTIFANFHGADPNTELVEINVRKACFYPEKTGVNYITVRGFEMAHAASPWTPPTADQPGLIGANWSRGWIIENNIIHDAKCSAISIGKEASTGHNDRTNRKDKPGYQYQLESVFKAAKIGWSKEKIGSHIIRNNVIYDCGQNGIVGHLGCVFSEIYDNHIYNIAIKREFYGHEIAGIKLHAPIDVHIHGNRIHSCSLGIWLDWQAQGSRISKNLLYDNNRDLFVEVSHGPTLVDYNVFGSKYALHNDAQGVAYVHNLFAGKFALHFSTDRSTPYHTPHSTEVAGFSATFGGDDRYFQNIFIGGQTPETVGTAYFNGYPTSLQEYIDIIDAKQPCDHGEFMKTKQPVYISGNVYVNGAKAFDKEKEKLDCPEFDAKFSIEAEGNKVYLNISMPENFRKFNPKGHNTTTLGRVRIVDADFENFDGSFLTLDTDYFSVLLGSETVPGPFAGLDSGNNKILVWG